MKKQLTFILTALIWAMIWQSCLKDAALTDTAAVIAPIAASDRTDILITADGTQRIIPYRTEVIRQAYQNLYGCEIPDLSPNYLYVRFCPQSPKHLRALTEAGIDLWDFRLDVEDIDPGTDPEEGPWKYSVVQADFAFPDMPYEILEKLALVPEQCKVAQEAFRLTNNRYDIPETFAENPQIEEGTVQYKILPDEDSGGGGGSGGGGTTGECGCPIPSNVRYPSGCVQVFDNMLNSWEGVRQVKVQTASTQIFGIVFHRTTQTDQNGCWKIPYQYHGNIHVWVKWTNSTCDIKTMNYDQDLFGYTFPRKAYIGAFGGPDFNNLPIKFNFTNDIGSSSFKNWISATVNNAVFDFDTQKNAQGINGSLPNNLKILISTWDETNTGATPMLNNIGIGTELVTIFSAYPVLTPLLGIPLASIVPFSLIWLDVAAPDIVFNINDPGEVNADDMRELVYHELAHALHFNQVGVNYWAKNMEYIMNHGGYGDGTAPGAGRCSVVECWGFEIGASFAHLRYGVHNSNGSNSNYFTYRKLLERDLAWVNTVVPHIPHGWLWDLQDNNATNPPNETEHPLVTDRVYGINNAQIFSVMTDQVTSMSQMKAALQPYLPPAVSVADYNELSLPYGF